MSEITNILDFVHTCNGKGDKDVRGPWGKWSHLECGRRRGPGPPGGEENEQLASESGGGQTFSRCQKARGTGSTRHQGILMHRIHIIVCIVCNNLCTLDDYNREPCFTLSICFRRINHMAVKNHLHSSSGVREVVLGTIYTIFVLFQEKILPLMGLLVIFQT